MTIFRLKILRLGSWYVGWNKRILLKTLNIFRQIENVPIIKSDVNKLKIFLKCWNLIPSSMRSQNWKLSMVKSWAGLLKDIIVNRVHNFLVIESLFLILAFFLFLHNKLCNFNRILIPHLNCVGEAALCFSEAIFIKLESSTKLRASNNPLLRARGFLAHSMTIITPSSNKTYIKLRKVQLLAGFWLSPSSSILLLLFGGGQGARRSRLVLCRHTCAVST